MNTSQHNLDVQIAGKLSCLISDALTVHTSRSCSCKASNPAKGPVTPFLRLSLLIFAGSKRLEMSDQKSHFLNQERGHSVIYSECQMVDFALRQEIMKYIKNRSNSPHAHFFTVPISHTYQYSTSINNTNNTKLTFPYYGNSVGVSSSLF